MKIFLKILYIFVAAFFYILLGGTGTFLIISSFGLAVGITPYLVGPIFRALIGYGVIRNIILKNLENNPAVTRDPKGKNIMADIRKTIKQTVIIIFVLDYLLMAFLYFFPK